MKACTFERIAFISFGFGRGAQVGKTSLLEVEFITAQASTLGVFIFYLVRFKPWDPAQTRDLSTKTAHFCTMQSKDSETTHFLGSGPVLRHNNACVRDVLTAPSNMYLNLGLNQFHSYF